ncbi:hypothetical protein [Streptomyces sp.]|uniref:hypothetical protein n=1 Tax=Streptomyces sp. TaxID=1931 RepID=UPI002F3F73C7
MDLAAQLAEVDRLRLLGFPAQRVRGGAVASGPGFHLADLAVSEDLGDIDPARRAEIEDDFGAACQALVELLARRWGDPEPLDLAPYLSRLVESGDVPPPLDRLCGLTAEVYGWRVADRWIAVGVGRGDAESPYELVLAIGERERIPGEGADRRSGAAANRPT